MPGHYGDKKKAGSRPERKKAGSRPVNAGSRPEVMKAATLDLLRKKTKRKK